MKWVTKGIAVVKTLGYNILIPAPKDEEINKIDENSEYTVTLTKKSKKRSLNANAYAWVLCDKIARELSKNAYISKNDVYKRVIQEAGPAKMEGYTIIRAYHGSSVYTVDEMRRLIDALVDECNQLNIPIENDDYINSLVREWGEHEQKEKTG